jgi:hypothetical protein
MSTDKPSRANVVGGPIELRDYDFLKLAQPHTAALPDGTAVELPAGTSLVRHRNGAAITQPNGLAAKGKPGPSPEV